MDKYSMATRVPVNNGKYIFDKTDLLGCGATAKVYTGFNRTTGKRHAIKEFKPELYATLQYEKEFNTLKSMNHRNIVRFYDTEQMDGKNYIILEYCLGNSVRTTLQKAENYYGFPPKLFFRFQSDISEALKFLDSINLVHTDLKPDNIMEDLDRWHNVIFKLSDFGTAQSINKINPNKCSPIFGTNGYIPPEMLTQYINKTRAILDVSKVDGWCLGVTLYQIATGRIPFLPAAGVNDSKIMNIMINKKPTNAISANQNPVVNNIIWSTKLPKTCRISFSQKEVLTTILANLLKTDFNERSSFDDYYKTSRQFLEVTPFEVFYANTGEIFTALIDISKPVSSSQFQETINEVSEVHTSLQLLMVNRKVAHNYWENPNDIRNQLVKSSSICLYCNLLNTDSDLSHDSIAPEFTENLIFLDPHTSKTDLHIFKKNIGIAFLKMEDMDINHKKLQLIEESFIGLTNLVKKKYDEVGVLIDFNEKQINSLNGWFTDTQLHINKTKQSIDNSHSKLSTSSKNNLLSDYFRKKQKEFDLCIKELESLHQQYITSNEKHNTIDFYRDILLHAKKYSNRNHIDLVNHNNEPATGRRPINHSIDECSSCNHRIVQLMEYYYNTIHRNAEKMNKHNYIHTDASACHNESNIREFIELTVTLVEQQSDCCSNFMINLFDNHNKSFECLKSIKNISSFIKIQEEINDSLSRIQVEIRTLNNNISEITFDLSDSITTISSIDKKKVKTLKK